MRRADPVAAEILRHYRDEGGRRVGVHASARWATCPFPAVESLVPRHGRVLDIGCGHGTFAAYAATLAPERRIDGVDVDGEKLAVGTRVLARLGLDDRVHLAVVEPGWRPPPNTYDALVIVDVLYLLGERRARELVEAAARSLVEGGVLVVKEMDTRPRAKWWWNQLQERLAVQVLRITEGDRVAPVVPERIGDAMVAHDLVVSSHEWHQGYVHPHLGLVGRRR